MANRLNKLSARGVATLSKPGRHSDGGGLYLLVKPTGAKSFVFLWKRNGRQREMGLGAITSVTLARAREKASLARSELAEGRDPLAGRARKRAQTFGEAADGYIDAMAPQWRNGKHVHQWRMTLTEYAAPLRPKPVAAIETADVLEVLRPLWATKPETASRLRGRIEAVLDAAKASGLREGENPARWKSHLEQLLPRRQRLTRGHHTAMPYAEVPDFMQILRKAPGVAARALEFAVLTSARTGEVLGAKWEEFDLGAGIWTVPRERMKAGREHRVPLSPAALAIVRALAAVPMTFVFPGAKAERPLSNMALDMCVRRLKVDATVHGFRSSFRDWAAETTGFPHEVAEMALAHTIKNKAEAAYRRGDLFEKRRELMAAWAEYCAGERK